jgi:hypothetical protein
MASHPIRTLKYDKMKVYSGSGGNPPRILNLYAKREW